LGGEWLTGYKWLPGFGVQPTPELSWNVQFDRTRIGQTSSVHVGGAAAGLSVDPTANVAPGMKFVPGRAVFQVIYPAPETRDLCLADKGGKVSTLFKGRNAAAGGRPAAFYEFDDPSVSADGAVLSSLTAFDAAGGQPLSLAGMNVAFDGTRDTGDLLPDFALYPSPGDVTVAPGAVTLAPTANGSVTFYRTGNNVHMADLRLTPFVEIEYESAAAADGGLQLGAATTEWLLGTGGVVTPSVPISWPAAPAGGKQRIDVRSLLVDQSGALEKQGVFYMTFISPSTPVTIKSVRFVSPAGGKIERLEEGLSRLSDRLFGEKLNGKIRPLRDAVQWALEEGVFTFLPAALSPWIAGVAGLSPSWATALGWVLFAASSALFVGSHRAAERRLDAAFVRIVGALGLVLFPGFFWIVPLVHAAVNAADALGVSVRRAARRLALAPAAMALLAFFSRTPVARAEEPVTGYDLALNAAKWGAGLAARGVGLQAVAFPSQHSPVLKAGQLELTLGANLLRISPDWSDFPNPSPLLAPTKAVKEPSGFMAGYAGGLGVRYGLFGFMDVGLHYSLSPSILSGGGKYADEAHFIFQNLGADARAALPLKGRWPDLTLSGGLDHFFGWAKMISGSNTIILQGSANAFYTGAVLSVPEERWGLGRYFPRFYLGASVIGIRLDAVLSGNPPGIGPTKVTIGTSQVIAPVTLGFRESLPSIKGVPFWANVTVQGGKEAQSATLSLQTTLEPFRKSSKTPATPATPSAPDRSTPPSSPPAPPSNPPKAPVRHAPNGFILPELLLFLGGSSALVFFRAAAHRVAPELLLAAASVAVLGVFALAKRRALAALIAKGWDRLRDATGRRGRVRRDADLLEALMSAAAVAGAPSAGDKAAEIRSILREKSPRSLGLDGKVDMGLLVHESLGRDAAERKLLLSRLGKESAFAGLTERQVMAGLQSADLALRGQAAADALPALLEGRGLALVAVTEANRNQVAALLAAAQEKGTTVVLAAENETIRSFLDGEVAKSKGKSRVLRDTTLIRRGAAPGAADVLSAPDVERGLLEESIVVSGPASLVLPPGMAVAGEFNNPFLRDALKILMDALNAVGLVHAEALEESHRLAQEFIASQA
jgi:hypothetical protein